MDISQKLSLLIKYKKCAIVCSEKINKNSYHIDTCEQHLSIDSFRVIRAFTESISGQTLSQLYQLTQ